MSGCEGEGDAIAASARGEPSLVTALATVHVELDAAGNDIDADDDALACVGEEAEEARSKAFAKITPFSATTS